MFNPMADQEQRQRQQERQNGAASIDDRGGGGGGAIGLGVNVSTLSSSSSGVLPTSSRGLLSSCESSPADLTMMGMTRTHQPHSSSSFSGTKRRAAASTGGSNLHDYYCHSHSYSYGDAARNDTEGHGMWLRTVPRNALFGTGEEEEMEKGHRGHSTSVLLERRRQVQRGHNTNNKNEKKNNAGSGSLMYGGGGGGLFSSGCNSTSMANAEFETMSSSLSSNQCQEENRYQTILLGREMMSMNNNNKNNVALFGGGSRSSGTIGRFEPPPSSAAVDFVTLMGLSRPTKTIKKEDKANAGEMQQQPQQQPFQTGSKSASSITTQQLLLSLQIQQQQLQRQSSQLQSQNQNGSWNLSLLQGRNHANTSTTMNPFMQQLQQQNTTGNLSTPPLQSPSSSFSSSHHSQQQTQSQLQLQLQPQQEPQQHARSPSADNRFFSTVANYFDDIQKQKQPPSTQTSLSTSISQQQLSPQKPPLFPPTTTTTATARSEKCNPFTLQTQPHHPFSLSALSSTWEQTAIPLKNPQGSNNNTTSPFSVSSSSPSPPVKQPQPQQQQLCRHADSTTKAASLSQSLDVNTEKSGLSSKNDDVVTYDHDGVTTKSKTTTSTTATTEEEEAEKVIKAKLNFMAKTIVTPNSSSGNISMNETYQCYEQREKQDEEENGDEVNHNVSTTKGNDSVVTTLEDSGSKNTPTLNKTDSSDDDDVEKEKKEEDVMEVTDLITAPATTTTATTTTMAAPTIQEGEGREQGTTECNMDDFDFNLSDLDVMDVFMMDGSQKQDDDDDDDDGFIKMMNFSAGLSSSSLNYSASSLLFSTTTTRGGGEGEEKGIDGDSKIAGIQEEEGAEFTKHKLEVSPPPSSSIEYLDAVELNDCKIQSIDDDDSTTHEPTSTGRPSLDHSVHSGMASNAAKVSSNERNDETQSKKKGIGDLLRESTISSSLSSSSSSSSPMLKSLRTQERINLNVSSNHAPTHDDNLEKNKFSPNDFISSLNRRIQDTATVRDVMQLGSNDGRTVKEFYSTCSTSSSSNNKGKAFTDSQTDGKVLEEEYSASAIYMPQKSAISEAERPNVLSMLNQPQQQQKTPHGDEHVYASTNVSGSSKEQQQQQQQQLQSCQEQTFSPHHLKCGAEKPKPTTETTNTDDYNKMEQYLEEGCAIGSGGGGGGGGCDISWMATAILNLNLVSNYKNITPDKYGMLPIHMACLYCPNDVKLVKTLLGNNSDIARLCVKDPGGDGPSSDVTKPENSQIMTMASLTSNALATSKREVDPSFSPNNYYESFPIHIALRSIGEEKSSYEVVKALATIAPDVLVQPDKTGAVPLSIALLNKVDSKLIRYLLEKNRGAARKPDKKNDYPLHIACRNVCGKKRYSVMIIQTILEAYPNAVHQRNSDGRTPLDLLDSASFSGQGGGESVVAV